MEGTPNFTPENKTEKDTDDNKSEKKSSKKGRQIGGFVAGAEKAAEHVEKKEKVAKESASLLDKIFNPEKQATVLKPSETDGEKKPERGEKTPEVPPLSAQEQLVAEALAEEGEIDLRDIPAERDDEIVMEAVEMALKKQLAETDEATAAQDTQAAPVETTKMSEEEPEVSEPEPLDVTSPEAPAADDVENDETASASWGASSASGSSTVSAFPTGTVSAKRSTSPASSSPVVPPSSPTRPPFSRSRFAPGSAYTAPPAATTYTAPAVANTTITPTAAAGAIEDAEYYAYKRGRNKGLVTGLIVGGGIEHIRHKRREKKMERKFSAERKEQTKKIEDMRWDQVRETDAAAVREAAVAKFKTREYSPVATRPEPAKERYIQPAAEVMKQRAEIQSEIENKLAAERKESERVLSKAEQVELERQREQLALAQGHHIERSAWHNIEVDTHGKAVQESSFEYGHEYYKERAHETGPKSKQLIDGAAGEVALVAAALSGGEASSAADSTAGRSTTTAASRPDTIQSNDYQQKSVLKSITQPPTTPAGTAGWFVVLVVLLAIFAIVLF